LKKLKHAFAILFTLLCLFNTACNDDTDDIIHKHEVSLSEDDITEIIGEEESENVYFTKTGECYHRSECVYLKSKIPISIDDALENGLRPCLRCDPPSP